MKGLSCILAATYFPRGLPPKYRRRGQLSRPCSGWERVGRHRQGHQKAVSSLWGRVKGLVAFRREKVRLFTSAPPPPEACARTTGSSEVSVFGYGKRFVFMVTDLRLFPNP